MFAQTLKQEEEEEEAKTHTHTPTHHSAVVLVVLFSCMPSHKTTRMPVCLKTTLVVHRLNGIGSKLWPVRRPIRAKKRRKTLTMLVWAVSPPLHQGKTWLVAAAIDYGLV